MSLHEVSNGRRCILRRAFSSGGESARPMSVRSRSRHRRYEWYDDQILEAPVDRELCRVWGWSGATVPRRGLMQAIEVVAGDHNVAKRLAPGPKTQRVVVAHRCGAINGVAKASGAMVTHRIQHDAVGASRPETRCSRRCVSATGARSRNARARCNDSRTACTGARHRLEVRACRGHRR